MWGGGEQETRPPQNILFFFKEEIENKQMIMSTTAHLICKRIVRTLRVFSIRLHSIPFFFSFFSKATGGREKEINGIYLT